jgi:hypothetical protein
MEAAGITLDNLKAYLHHKYGIDPIKINRETSLLYDLGMKGDDVDDFFRDLAKAFKIEITKLDLTKFFIGNEPLDFMSPIIRFFKREDVSKKPTITVGDIERFIETGVL